MPRAVGLAGLLLAFALLGWAVSAALPAVLAWDARVAQGLQAALQGAPSRWLACMTHLGDVLWLVALATAVAGVLWRRGRRRMAWRWCGAGLVTAAGIYGSKYLIGRPRPEAVRALMTEPSYPSGHTVGALVVYGGLLMWLWPLLPARWRAPALMSTAALVAGVGISRISLGVHYPSDVLGGLLLGGALLWALYGGAVKPCQ